MTGQARVRPLLLVDVDGVLLVTRGRDDDGQPAHAPFVVPEAGRWLTELAAHFDLCWATSWEHVANEEIGPAIGIGPLPVIEFDMDYATSTPKLRSAAAFVADRPCAWMDDDLGWDAIAWAEGRAAPTLLVHIDGTEGLTRMDVDALLEFAASL
ncbi:MAG: hypothetical protein WCK58_14235 [Chloroflexota bacterium]